MKFVICRYIQKIKAKCIETGSVFSERYAEYDRMLVTLINFEKSAEINSMLGAQSFAPKLPNIQVCTTIRKNQPVFSSVSTDH